MLLAATNRLEPHTVQTWQQTRTAGNPWRRLVEHLQQAPPVPLQRLHHVLSTLRQLATHTGQAPTQSETDLPSSFHEAGACQPPGTLVHLPWAVDLFQQPSGYIPATAQEALLHAFLGEALASTAATLAQQWGELINFPPTTTGSPHAEPPTTTDPPRPTPNQQQAGDTPQCDSNHGDTPRNTTNSNTSSDSENTSSTNSTSSASARAAASPAPEPEPTTSFKAPAFASPLLVLTNTR